MDTAAQEAPVAPGYARYPNWREWWLVSEFRRKYPHDIPTPGHLQSMAAIVDGLGSPWNIPTNWDKCNWYKTTRGAISLTYRHGLATFDSGRLTSLVLAAHRNCVRVEIAPAGPTNIRITFWPRDPDATSGFERHPDLAELAAKATEDHTNGKD